MFLLHLFISIFLLKAQVITILKPLVVSNHILCGCNKTMVCLLKSSMNVHSLACSTLDDLFHERVSRWYQGE